MSWTRSILTLSYATRLNRSFSNGAKVRFYVTRSVKQLKDEHVNEKKSIGSTTTVSTSMASAFNNMFDDSATRSVTLVKQIRDDGFLLSTGVRLFGPVILLNGDVFLWDVPQNSKLSDEWNVDFMKIFDVIVPKPELLIIGTGKSIVPIAPKIRQYIHKLGMQIEILDTKNASSTFNVLTEEGRRVAAALLPLNPTSARTGKAL